MAEPLKNQFGPEIPRSIAAMIAEVYPTFDREGFLAHALDGYEPLSLMARGHRIAESLRVFLPDRYPEALAILMRSLKARSVPAPVRTDSAMASFFYLPHTAFVARYGLENFELSLDAQFELTKLFTAEFSIRPFLERHPEETLARLQRWAGDPNENVRRLVSEGTRPRLPWASRLSRFQDDPTPVLELLELLKDDPQEYVRRSVANNLNDIGKDHPEVLLATARRWIKDAPEPRRRLVRHALRSLVKQGDADALQILGFGRDPKVLVNNPRVIPESPGLGDTVSVTFDLQSIDTTAQHVLVDLRVHFVRANGTTGPKVFKLKTVELAPGQQVRVKKSVSLAEKTTRKHYPGEHTVEGLLNGTVVPLGTFELTTA